MKDIMLLYRIIIFTGCEGNCLKFWPNSLDLSNGLLRSGEIFAVF